jgi:hypothetical protein
MATVVAHQPTEIKMHDHTGLRDPLIALAIALAVTSTVALVLEPPEPFYYDSGGYWTLGNFFTVHGHFSLLNFDSPLRGYFMPLIYHGLDLVVNAFKWSASSVVKVFNALIFSLIGAVLGPKLAELTWPGQRWGVLRRLALVALLLLFWSGFLPFPLTDFPALAMSMLALICVSRSNSPAWMLVAGLSTAATINMRPSYVLILPIVVVLVFWAWFERHRTGQVSIKRGGLCVGLLIVGFLAVSVPQSLSMHRHFGTWDFVPGAPAHLSTLQLTEGMKLQRYETYVSPGHTPQIRYEDNAGTRLLLEQKNGVIGSTRQYLQLIVSHPLVMGNLFLHHVINGLDQRYATLYVKHLDKGSHRWFRAIGFLLIFLMLLRVLWPAARRRLGVALWRYPTGLALCCLTVVPSAVETRYMLPVYLLSYMLILEAGWPNPLGPKNVGLRRFRTPVAIVVSYATFMVIVVLVTSNASSNLHFG